MARVASGGSWQEIFLYTPRSISTSGNGRATARSIVFIRRSWRDAAKPAGARATPRRQSSIRRLRKRPKRGVSIDPVGYDAGKKIKGIKRNALVDTEGYLLALEVIPGNIRDRDSAAGLIERAL